jgi:RNA-directed DNA polymerase
MDTLFSEVVEFKNLHAAYRAARMSKRYRDSILKFGFRIEENLTRLQHDLEAGRYAHGRYREFIINDSKKRLIKAAPFRDRVVHHAVCNIIEPILERTFISDSFACRKGKGSHAAVKRLESFMRSIRSTGNIRTYCLKCDISKFFDTVDNRTLLAILARNIPDENLMRLIREIVDSNPQGIPIGNLTSQLFANVYLNELDHFVKRELHEHYYLRYMDDFLILGTDKAHLSMVRESIRAFLRNRLKLTLHPKKAEIAPIAKGVEFLGYVLYGNGHRRLRKSTVKRFVKKRRVRAAMVKSGKMTEELYARSLDSWRGYAAFADSYRLMEALGIGKRII